MILYRSLLFIAAAMNDTPYDMKLSWQETFTDFADFHTFARISLYRKRGKFHWAKLSYFSWFFREAQKFFLCMNLFL